MEAQESSWEFVDIRFSIRPTIQIDDGLTFGEIPASLFGSTEYIVQMSDITTVAAPLTLT